MVDIIINSVTLPNPGANVGYKNYSEFYKDGGVWKVRDKEGNVVARFEPTTDMKVVEKAVADLL